MMKQIEKVRYIYVKAVHNTTGEVREGILDTFTNGIILKSIKIITAAGQVVYMSKDAYAITEIIVSKEKSHRQHFFKNIDRDQKNAFTLVEELADEYGAETSLEGELRLSWCYTNKNPKELKTGTTVDTKVEKPKTTAIVKVNVNKPAPVKGPVVLERTEPLEEKALQNMKTMVEQISLGLVIDLPEIEGGTDLPPKTYSYNQGTYNKKAQQNYADTYGYGYDYD